MFKNNDEKQKCIRMIVFNNKLYMQIKIEKLIIFVQLHKIELSLNYEEFY